MRGKTNLYGLLFEVDDNTLISKAPMTVQSGQKSRPSKDSVDDQIDAFILKYEKASIVEKKDKTFQESMKRNSLKFLLEADSKVELEDKPEDAPASGTPPAGAQPSGAPPAPTSGENPLPDPASQTGGSSSSSASAGGMPDFSSMFSSTPASPGTPPAEGSAPTTPQPPATEPPVPNGSEKMNVTEPPTKENVPDLDIDKFTARIVRLVNNHRNLLSIEEAIVNRAKNFLDEEYGDNFVREFLKTLEENYGIAASEVEQPQENEPENWAVGAWAGGTGGPGGA